MADVIVYGNFVGDLISQDTNWDSDTIKVALVEDTYTPNQNGHDSWSDVEGDEASGTGYTAGGATLGSKTSSYDSNVHTLDAADVSWTSSTITARYGVLYVEGGTPGDSPLIAYVDFGENKSSSDGTFQISWGANGIITFTVPTPA